MLAPIDFTNVQTALSKPAGWIELGMVAVCLAIAWQVERRALAARDEENTAVAAHRLHASFTRVVFPATALALVLIATFVYRRYVGPPLFLAIASPLLIALGAIRMIVYGLRRLFRSQQWLPASERAISFAVWLLALLYFVGLLPEIASALEDVRIPIGKSEVSLASIGTALLVVAFTLIVTLWISGMIEQRLANATQLDVNLRVVLAKFIKALLLVVAIMIALSAIGFDLTLLSVFGGALGVGIGLGLQKLASNYIAGFTILLDRSIRLGDVVTVDGRMGVVSKVTSRYVVVRSLDGVDAIVPNETLVTTTVLNHSYSTRYVRVGVPVQVSYDSDVEKALTLMEKIARATPRVLSEPHAPAAALASFGDSGVNLELGIWIGDPENGQGNVRSEINRALLKAFAENGIRLPAPQRDIRVLEVPPSLRSAADAEGRPPGEQKPESPAS